MTQSKRSVARKGIMAGGNWIIDQVKIIDVYPRPESLANISAQSKGTGGCPFNVLVDLARFPVAYPLAAAGLVGKDPMGDEILRRCKKHGIRTRLLGRSPDLPTSYTDVMTVKGGGQRTFFHNRGANAAWDGRDIDFAATRERIFLLGYLLLLDALDLPDKRHGTRAAALLARARRAGLRTCIDVVSEDSDRFRKIVLPALKYTDYCILNELEAGRTSGFTIRRDDGSLDTAALRHAAGALLEAGINECVIIHFPEGAFARTRDGRDCWQSSLKLPARHIVGTAGAGDAFCAGALHGLHEGWDLQECLETGVCAAAASLSEPTCTDGIQSLDAARALMKQFRRRPPLI